MIGTISSGISDQLGDSPPLSTLFITLHALKIMESLDNRFTSQVDFNNRLFDNDDKHFKLFISTLNIHIKA
jgi:hypothetical protein